jgi:hypothetical protein
VIELEIPRRERFELRLLGRKRRVSESDYSPKDQRQHQCDEADDGSDHVARTIRCVMLWQQPLQEQPNYSTAERQEEDGG